MRTAMFVQPGEIRGRSPLGGGDGTPGVLEFFKGLPRGEKRTYAKGLQEGETDEAKEVEAES